MDVLREVELHSIIVHKWCKEQKGQPLPWVTMLYGSQNYGLESPDSDVDTKSMVLPSLEMVLLDNSRISTEITMPDGSLDNVKDVREMFGNYLKGNINFVETLFTPYYKCMRYGAHWEYLRSHRNLISNARPKRLMHMAAGMAKQKYEAFSHPYESKKEVLAKYGYDPKQLHHLVRLYYFMQTFLESQSFYAALYSVHPRYDGAKYNELMALKTQPYKLEYASQLREEYMEKVDELVARGDQSLSDDNGYEHAVKFLHDLSYDLLKDHLKEGLK